MLENGFAGRVLVVAPHYDDEVIGCGGTLLRFRHRITHLVLFHITAASPRRRAEFELVRGALRPDQCYAVGAQDGFSGRSAGDAVVALVRAIQLERPDFVLAPHPQEAHSDHRETSRITLDALEKARFWDMPPPATPHRVPVLVEYEVWTALSSPSVVCDITEVFRTKCELVSLYSSQVARFPYSEYVTALNGWRGLLFLRCGQAEVFGLRAI
jgi:LmbE family N-acetylglucosaminyl deacetylase